MFAGSAVPIYGSGDWFGVFEVVTFNGENPQDKEKKLNTTHNKKI